MSAEGQKQQAGPNCQPPALPWAHAEPDAQPNAAPEDDGPEFIDLEAAKLSAGDKIEVKWLLQQDDEEAPRATWWTATVAGPSDKKDTTNADAPVYDLRYVAKQDDGFEEEVCSVVFTSERTLRDLKMGQLVWRREGEDWDVSDSDSEEDGDDDSIPDSALETGPNGEVLVNLDKYYKSLEESGQIAAEEAQMSAELEKMQPNVRAAIASGFRDFTDGLREFIAAKCAREGDGCIITSEDVAQFMRELRGSTQQPNKRPRI